MTEFSAISYLVSGGLYFLLSILLLVNWRGRPQGRLFIIASFVSLVWSLVLAYEFLTQNVSGWLLFCVEILRDSAWIILALKLLSNRRQKLLPQSLVIAMLVVCLSVLLYGAVIEHYNKLIFFTEEADELAILGVLFLSLCGLVIVEQLYRNTSSEYKSSINYLCIGIGAFFAYDIYMYSQAFLFHKIDINLLGTRGLLNAFVVPFIAVSIIRNPSLSIRLFVSRQVMFYSTSLLGAGIYMLAIAMGGYYVKSYGGEWGNVLQIVFLFGGGVLLLVVLSSASSRARLKVLLNKHFYHTKYDYREEWIQLTKTLSVETETFEIRKRVIVAFANILESKGGMLWLQQESNGYACVTAMDTEYLIDYEEENSDFIYFLKDSKWVVDLNEYKDNPELYDHLTLPDWLAGHKTAWLIIPILQQEELLGFVVMLQPKLQRKINWEDHDILKLTANQIASYLALIKANEELDQVHQFEAFNRLSAYVVHDLNNLVAQLGLVVTNAVKYKDNPAFMDDVIKTIENAVEKMGRLLAQLRKNRFHNMERSKIHLNKEIAESVKNLSASEPVPGFIDCKENMTIFAYGDRFSSIVEHLIRNAQDATPDDGQIDITLSRDEDFAIIKVSDTGVGMSMDFIRTNLFKPFYTTKGNAGMGIGMYECKQFVQQLGGRLSVQSEPDKGTTITVALPLNA